MDRSSSTPRDERRARYDQGGRSCASRAVLGGWGPRVAAVIGWSLLSLFAGSGAWADEPARSIMFEPLDAERRDLTTLPTEREADRGERCTALARELEALKGKPQRRYAVSQQFEAECGR